MKLSGGPESAFALIAAFAVLAVALGGCGGSTAPNIKAPQRGMTEDIGGVIEEKNARAPSASSLVLN